MYKLVNLQLIAPILLFNSRMTFSYISYQFTIGKSHNIALYLFEYYDRSHNNTVYFFEHCSFLWVAVLVAETCRSTFVNQILVQAIVNKLVYM
jgi:hypothetical protein